MPGRRTWLFLMVLVACFAAPPLVTRARADVAVVVGPQVDVDNLSFADVR